MRAFFSLYYARFSMRIPILGRKDMYIHLDVTRGVTVDHTAIGGMPMQSVKLLQLGWACETSGASGSIVTGVGGSTATEPVVTAEEPPAEEAAPPVEETPADVPTKEPAAEVPTEEPSVPEQAAAAPTSDPEDDLPPPEEGGWYS